MPLPQLPVSMSRNEVAGRAGCDRLSAAPAQNRKNIPTLAEAFRSRRSGSLGGRMVSLQLSRAEFRPARLPVTEQLPLPRSNAGSQTSLALSPYRLFAARGLPPQQLRSLIFRTPEQIERLEAYVGNARLVKHLSALSSGESLVGYDAAARSLYVPIGADLPGIFGRTACLASGLAPQRDEQKQLLVYRDVPTDIAAQVIMKLST